MMLFLPLCSLPAGSLRAAASVRMGPAWSLPDFMLFSPVFWFLPRTENQLVDQERMDIDNSSKILTLSRIRRRHLDHQTARSGYSAAPHPLISVAAFTCHCIGLRKRVPCLAYCLLCWAGIHCLVVLSPTYTALCRCHHCTFVVVAGHTYTISNLLN